jgi:hypothetical protein
VRTSISVSLLLVTAALPAIGATITTSASVTCWTTTDVNIHLTSSGADINCFGTAYGADANASAVNGNLLVAATAGSLFSENTLAMASISYSDTLIAQGGTGAGTLIGRYMVSGSAMADFEGIGVYARFTQGDGVSSFRPFTMGSFSEEIDISSTFMFGQPFALFVNGSALASSPGDEISNLTIEILGFTDQNGAPLTVVSATVVSAPEPSTLPVMSVALVLVICSIEWRSRYRSRRDKTS